VDEVQELSTSHAYLAAGAVASGKQEIAFNHRTIPLIHGYM
jgi:hypothetical protein